MMHYYNAHALISALKIKNNTVEYLLLLLACLPVESSLQILFCDQFKDRNPLALLAPCRTRHPHMRDVLVSLFSSSISPQERDVSL